MAKKKTRKRRANKFDMQLKRVALNKYNYRTYRVEENFADRLTELLISKEIPKFNSYKNELVYRKYSMNDLFFDLYSIYLAVVSGIKKDPDLLKKYPYKSFKPYYVLQYLVKSGINIDELDLEDLVFSMEQEGEEDGS